MVVILDEKLKKEIDKQVAEEMAAEQQKYFELSKKAEDIADWQAWRADVIRAEEESQEAERNKCEEDPI